ncbi:hypothetical protein CC86DRAFT_46472 [Ophiobolus disseminans]|uniref:Uncharacterized protein n=1 Tax=Ophiobolus disseminans TaxID=1469910 RepID=A0A6A6ZUL6_9PLEO|nr:hypothetical protein CC86DRAFT_46472 [Ophiobolus disseminans]
MQDLASSPGTRAIPVGGVGIEIPTHQVLLRTVDDHEGPVGAVFFLASEVILGFLGEARFVLGLETVADGHEDVIAGRAWEQDVALGGGGIGLLVVLVQCVCGPGVQEGDFVVGALEGARQDGESCGDDFVVEPFWGLGDFPCVLFCDGAVGVFVPDCLAGPVWLAGVVSWCGQLVCCWLDCTRWTIALPKERSIVGNLLCWNRW